MGRFYTATFDNEAETTIVDLFELVAGSADIVVIHEIGISQGTEVGDGEEEMLNVVLTSGYTTSGSGGSTATPAPVLVGDAAAGVTCEYCNTTVATGGTPVEHYNWYWNVRIPLQMVWTPETRPVLAPSRRMVLRLNTAPADSITFGGYIVFEEIG